MKIVVIGGTGLIGTKLVSTLRRCGHEVVAASLDTGVNVITGEGLRRAVEGAEVLVDVANSPSFEDRAALEFFETAGRQLLAAERSAGVQHHLTLSVVGSDRLANSGYLRAKLAQERLVETSGIPYTILRSTQFFEFVGAIIDSATIADEVRLSPALFQPVAADEVVAVLADLALELPLNSIVEVAGPEARPMDEIAREYLTATQDRRHVIADAHAQYFGSQIDDRSLTPGGGHRAGSISFTDWLRSFPRGRAPGPRPSASTHHKGEATMSTFKTKDGTTLYYKDWGTGPVVTFSHGWPLSADAWDGQMLFLAQNGYRVIAHDRRGHGRSEQPSSGNDMDTYADDLATLFEVLDLQNVSMVGHSTGGGEVARYIGRHGTARVARAVLIGAVPPLMLKTPANPEGTPLEVFDGIRAGMIKDRAQYFRDFAIPFYGANRPGSTVSQGVLDQFWVASMQGGFKNVYECVKAFSETDFNADLAKFDVPTLILHGEDDQIVPVRDAGMKSARLIKGAKAIFYPSAPHGLTVTHQAQVNADLLAFLRG